MAVIKITLLPVGLFNKVLYLITENSLGGCLVQLPCLGPCSGLEMLCLSGPGVMFDCWDCRIFLWYTVEIFWVGLICVAFCPFSASSRITSLSSLVLWHLTAEENKEIFLFGFSRPQHLLASPCLPWAVTLQWVLGFPKSFLLWGESLPKETFYPKQTNVFINYPVRQNFLSFTMSFVS